MRRNDEITGCWQDAGGIGDYTEEKVMTAGCKEFSVELSEYFDGELEPSAAESLEAHLNVCPGCQLELAKLKKLHNALHGLAAPNATGRRSILADLQAKLKEDDTPGSDPLTC